MAEERLEPREVNLRQWLPWTVLFRGFHTALDVKKLLLAAAGILVMAFGWWLLAIIFFSPRTKPAWPADFPTANFNGSEQDAWKAFKRARDQYNLLYDAAAPADRAELMDAGDLANNPQEFEVLREQIDK